jgi:hypothetical protein
VMVRGSMGEYAREFPAAKAEVDADARGIARHAGVRAECASRCSKTR